MTTRRASFRGVGNAGMTYRTAEEMSELNAGIVQNINRELPLKELYQGLDIKPSRAYSLAQNLGYRKILISREEFELVRKHRKAAK